MTRYEMRTPDLKAILGIWYHEGLPPSDWVAAVREIKRTNVAVLVLHEWESPDEADRARLDWLDGHYCPKIVMQLNGNRKQTVREAIDAVRNAPQPKVTVVG